MIRKPVEPVKVEGVGDAATGTSSTSATPATSNAPSPSPAATPTPTSASGTNNETKVNSDSSEVKECRDESKDKEVGITWIKFSREILFICSEKQTLISLPINVNDNIFYFRVVMQRIQKKIQRKRTMK